MGLFTRRATKPNETTKKKNYRKTNFVLISTGISFITQSKKMFCFGVSSIASLTNYQLVQNQKSNKEKTLQNN